LILWGNEGMSAGCTVQFIHTPTAPGDILGSYPAAVQVVDTQRLWVKIPVMPAGPAVVTSRAGTAGQVAGSVNITVNAVPPVLTGLSPTAGYAGQNVLLLGQAFLPPTNDLRVRLQWAPNRFDDVVPTHVPSPMPAVGPEALLVTLPPYLNAVPGGGFRGSISVYRGSLQLSSAPKEFQFQPVPTVTPPPSSCPAPPAIPGLVYVGAPTCGVDSNHPGAYRTCDATGYYCCDPEAGVNSKCGSNRAVFGADCSVHCPAVGNCLVGPQYVNGALVGCYKPQ
jgi:hypothetical protein